MPNARKEISLTTGGGKSDISDHKSKPPAPYHLYL